MNELLMSICIPTYNRVDKLNELLNFILNEFEKYSDKIEILVSDNASTDHTNELLKEKQKKKNKFIYWTNNTNLGLIGNLIKLAKEAKGQYIWYIGDDDILLPGISDEIFNIFENHNVIGGILLNHSAIHGEVENIVEQSLVPISGGFYIDGKEKVLDIVQNGKYGTMMFMTANIVRRDIVLNIANLCDHSNLALPLLWAMVSDKKNFYVVREIYLYDQYKGVSWKDDGFIVQIENVTDVFCSLEKFGYDKKEVRSCLKARLNNERSITLVFFKYLIKNPFKGILLYKKYGFINIVLKTPEQLMKCLIRKLSKGK